LSVTPQQMQGIQMMGQMMAQMVMTAVGKAFQALQPDLTEEQKRIADDAMALAQTQQHQMMEAQMIMERAMGKVLNRLEPAQVEKWDKHVKAFVTTNIPPGDDTTRAYLCIGTKIRTDELKMKALTTDAEEAQAQQVRIEAMALAQEGTPEATAKAQALVIEGNRKLEESYSDEFNKAKKDFIELLGGFRLCQFDQGCVQQSMSTSQQMMMARGQQEAMQQSSKAKQMQVMDRTQVQMQASFSAEQCELFLKFRTTLSRFGGGEFIDAATTARIEAKLRTSVPEPEPSGASDQGWGSWIADSVNSVASAVGAVLGDDDEVSLNARASS
jgi:hypothetical protein